MVLAKLKTRSLLSNRRADCTKYTYDASQNRRLMINSGVRTTYTCDAANQLNWLQDSTGRTTFSYDNNGNQTLERTPSGNRTTYSWDGENRLTQVQRATADRSTYTYKADGNLRVVAQEPASTSRFVWDGQIYLAETNAGGVTEATYSSEPTSYGNLLSQSRSAASSFFHADSQGSVMYLTDTAGIAADSYQYRAFGVIVFSLGSSPNPFRYNGSSGYYRDTSLYYARERYYAPIYGRFISTSMTVSKSSASDSCVSLNEDVRKDCIARGVNGNQLELILDWIASECIARGNSWLNELPACPCKIDVWDECTGIKIKMPPDWSYDYGQWFGYHHGSEFCIRSKKTIPVVVINIPWDTQCDAGQQCCYNNKGELITK